MVFIQNAIEAHENRPFRWETQIPPVPPDEIASRAMPSAACSMCSALLGGELGAHRRRTSRSPRRTSSCSGRNSCEGASDRADSRSLATRNESACIDVPLRLRLSIYLILGHALLLLGLLGVLLLCAPKSPPKARCTSSRQPTACTMTTTRSAIRKGGLGPPKSTVMDEWPNSPVLMVYE